MQETHPDEIEKEFGIHVGRQLNLMESYAENASTAGGSSNGLSGMKTRKRKSPSLPYSFILSMSAIWCSSSASAKAGRPCGCAS